jgi:hypothetical protein
MQPTHFPVVAPANMHERAPGVPDDHEDPMHTASLPENDSQRANTTLP